MAKIGVIVEGKSDVVFFKSYFKRTFEKYNLEVMPSVAGGKTCEITNPNTIQTKVSDLLDKGCEKVIVLLDLKTQCNKNRDFNCAIELKKWMLDKIKEVKNFEKIEVHVGTQDLEGWMLSAFGPSDNKGKGDLKSQLWNDSKKIPKKNIEEKMVQKFVAEKYQINPANNLSLKKFFERLDRLCNAS